MGISGQHGQKSFAYQFALTTHNQSFGATNAMKFAMEHQNPLVVAWTKGEPTAKSKNTFSLLAVNDPNVLLWSVKPSEEGIEKGLITRFWNMNSVSASPILKFSRPIYTAWQTSHIETNKEKLKLSKGVFKTKFNAFQMKTYRLMLE